MLGAQQQWVSDSVLVRECPDGRRIAFNANANDFELSAASFAQTDQFRNLLAARRAPACPEIDDQGFSLVAGQCDGLAIDVTQADREKFGFGDGGVGWQQEDQGEQKRAHGKRLGERKGAW